MSTKQKELCSECGQLKNIKTRKNNKNICHNCYNKNHRPKKTCSICSSYKTVAKITEEGKNVCISCYNKYYRPKRECFICRKESITKKLVKGKEVCTTCYDKYYRPKKKCDNCGLITLIHSTKNNKNLCKKCYYAKYRPKSECSICGSYDFIQKRVKDNTYCSSCYNKFLRKKQLCSICNNISEVSKNVNGKYICKSCYRSLYRTKKKCSKCNNIDFVHKRIDNNPICKSCYDKYYIPKHKCSICNSIAPAFIKTSEQTVCNKCYKKLEYKCPKCKKTTNYFNRTANLCTDCFYLEKINLLLNNSRKHFINQSTNIFFNEYANFIVNSRRPFSAYMHLNNKLKIFCFLDKNNISLNNVTFLMNTLLDNFHITQIFEIENFLLFKNLDGEITDKQKLKVYIKNYSQNLNDYYKKIFLDYCNYLQLICDKYELKGWENKLKYSTIKGYIYNVYVFLLYLSKKISSINELNNIYVEEFLSANNACNTAIGHFIKWINNNFKLFTELSVPKKKSYNSNLDFFSEKEYTSILENLALPQVSYRDKMICLLVIFYGLRPFEIAELKVSDFNYSNKFIYVSKRNTNIYINEYIADIIHLYLKLERTCHKYYQKTNCWLLLGRKFNSHLTSNGVNQVLYKYDIKAKKAFSTFMKNMLLSDKIIPAILIQGSGINIATFSEYFKLFNVTYVNNLSNLTSINSSINSSLEIEVQKYFTYILKCNDNSYYTGYTSNLTRRIKQHNNGTGSKYTKTRLPVSLVYYEEFSDRPSAIKREKQIKKLTVYEKEKLIEKSRME